MDYVKPNMNSCMNKYIKQTLLSVCFGGVGTIICILLCSLIISNIDLPMFVSNILILLAVAVGGLVGGYSNGRMIHQKGILVGGVCGLTLIIVMFLIKVIFFNPVPTFLTFIKFFVLLLFAVIGGIIGVNKKTKRIKY